MTASRSPGRACDDRAVPVVCSRIRLDACPRTVAGVLRDARMVAAALGREGHRFAADRPLLMRGDEVRIDALRGGGYPGAAADRRDGGVARRIRVVAAERPAPAPGTRRQPRGRRSAHRGARRGAVGRAVRLGRRSAPAPRAHARPARRPRAGADDAGRGAGHPTGDRRYRDRPRRAGAGRPAHPAVRGGRPVGAPGWTGGGGRGRGRRGRPRVPRGAGRRRCSRRAGSAPTCRSTRACCGCTSPRLAPGSPEPRALEHGALRWLGAAQLDTVDWIDADRAVLADLAALLR